MNSWVIIPVKPFKQGKSRLRAYFTRNDLYALNCNLFRQTIETVKAAACFEHILVISRGRHARSTALEAGLEALVEHRPSSLNAAVSQAMDFVSKQGGGQTLVLPTDLPLLQAEGLKNLKAQIPDRGVLIIPDHFYKGTNALAMSSPGLIEPKFGTNSFQAHCLQAQDRGLNLSVYYDQAIMQDLDTQPDLSLISRDHHLLKPISREERIEVLCSKE
mgnify:CR=1 FL=1